MSFILDALRKSDAERQRTATPGLADVRYAVHRSRRNIWIPVLVLVLLANMLFMGLQWYRAPGAAAPPAPTAVPAAAPAPAPAPAALPMPAPAGAPVPAPADIRPLAREADAGTAAPGPLAVTAPQPAAQPVRTAPAPAPAPAPADAPVAAAPPKPASRIVESSQLPTATDLIAAGTLSSPPLNLDLHVYSAAPGSRFVIINGRKYREGGQLTEGPSVETITAEGVILSSQGRRFVLLSQ